MDAEWCSSISFIASFSRHHHVRTHTHTKNACITTLFHTHTHITAGFIPGKRGRWQKMVSICSQVAERVCNCISTWVCLSVRLILSGCLENRQKYQNEKKKYINSSLIAGMTQMHDCQLQRSHGSRPDKGNDQ